MSTVLYFGQRLEPEATTASDVIVFKSTDDEKRTLEPYASLKLRGYGGSGPAQLALAILLDFTGDPSVAQKHYQDFKFHFVAGWADRWEITGDEIDAWLSKEKELAS